MGCVASREHSGDLSEKRALLAAYARAVPCDTSSRLAALRKLMSEAKLDAYIVPSGDDHASEYTAKCDARRAFISGFTGSAGTAVVLTDSAHLFTDGRYHIQAAAQLDSNWTLHKVGVYGVADWPEWIAGLPDGLSVGVDAALVDYTAAMQLVDTFAPRGIELVPSAANLVDEVWGDKRPKAVHTPIYEHELVYAGVPASQKLERLREWLPRGSLYVLSALDEVAWLLNLRGSSVPCTRTYLLTAVFPAYLAVDASSATLFIEGYLVANVKSYLSSIGVTIKPYASVFSWLADRTDELEEDDKVYLHSRASWALAKAAGVHAKLLGPDSPVALAKAAKNETELAGLRNAHLRDGAAWARWAAWLERQVEGGASVDEAGAAARLAEERASEALYAGTQAYDAISAAGPNAALPHYETPETGSLVIGRDAPFLMDAGPQYYDGTIDVTRTVHFGRPSAEHSRAFTRVLQGHIALARARFPLGTTGADLDILAREPLFRDGCNYLHGTGHGIGSFLGVHEGPHNINMTGGSGRRAIPLAEGMVVSIEPGFYEEGHYGIRTESLFAVRRVATRREFGGGPWLEFELLTRVPIDPRLVDYSLLSPDERTWLREHNALVYRDISPRVRDNRNALRWLRRQLC
ncbi:Xaa-Pro aminopeptidase [Malassezia cuniculi]|uniref:Xaa-Pro aminopeptidase n=1 Tax=Malassezia cuniculi TaxID=948313 RepID=A0AAF0ENN9_9BASI|nr:Xaa-Pro aminopeptidase [Malassezia cuniculi]